MSEQSPSPQQLAEWIARGAQGDEAACAAIFHGFYPTILRLSLGLLNDWRDAEEVAQDTFVYALKNLARFDAERSAFRTWLYTIALSRARNKRRRKLLEMLPLEALTGQSLHVPREVETALERRGLRRQLWQALQTLPEHLREALVLRYLGGMRYKEVADVMACNPKTAESRTRLGVEMMRRQLQSQGIAPDLALLEWSS